MKRNEIVERLIKEGFSEKTLVKFNDTQLNKLATKILSEESVMISKTSPTYAADLEAAKKAKKTIETYEEEKEEEIEEDELSVDDAEKLNNLNEWVKSVIKKNYHAVATKGDVMEAIKTKIAENESMIPMPAKGKKGHNGIPEFMTYDAITDAGQPSEAPTRRETPTRERPTREKEPSENPRKSPFRNPDKTPGQQPLVNPNPKAKGSKVVSLKPSIKTKMAAE
jgi:hypothetical protein